MSSPVEPQKFGSEGLAPPLAQPGTGPTQGAQPRREPITVTALFESRSGVEGAMDALYSAGTPRDLIEVVVSRAAAERHYADADGGIRRPGRETFRYAGIGGLLGFIIGVLIGLVMVALPGIEGPGGMALVQVFGPNMATVVGAALGAILGFFRRRRPDPRHARAAEASASIVLAVTTRSREEARVLGDIISAHGGTDVRVLDM